MNILSALAKGLISDRVILLLIIANIAVIFVSGFPLDEAHLLWLEAIDHAITGVFILEVLVKLRSFGFKGYFSDAWNRFDFLLVAVALPSFIVFFLPVHVVELHFLLALRVLRVFKFFRFIRFVPNMQRMVNGVVRAVRASLIIILTFIIFNVVVAIISSFLFKEVLPNYFGDPLISLYSIFKVFTMEGWYEIPDAIAESEQSDMVVFFTRLYFVIILFGGGIFGLSLVNSIFVDAMLEDNNDELIEKIDTLAKKVDELIKSKVE